MVGVGGVYQVVEESTASWGETDLAGVALITKPVGLRTSMDMKTNKPVDVVEVGRQKGVEVREVAGIYETY